MAAYQTRWAATLTQYKRTKALGGRFVILPHDLWGSDGTTSQAASSDMIAAVGLTGKPVKVDPHRETLKSVLHHAGLDLDDLTPEPAEP